MRKGYLVAQFGILFALLGCSVQDSNQSNSQSNVKVNQDVAVTDTVVREFTAFGGDENNAWRAVIQNNTMSLEMSKYGYYPNIEVTRSAYSKGAEFVGYIDSKEVMVDIRGTECRDSNNNLNEFSATLYYQGKIIKGCAVRGAYPHADT
ncbi:hypothetical protein [Otariodibacter oris]|uniref:Lipoprotein n=1 Tax=Otariodibacter oris TaxID=1032623 RepID=A0A420XH42_9PAST|nr:hypothetical protein [Otariodibacter oris]QGM81197.1 hypothetical protein A6A10_07150 [Otariodibacter oris]RKR72757.1 hypothetical protein DES31_0922 [Otariodibacter oris]